MKGYEIRVGDCYVGWEFRKSQAMIRASTAYMTLEATSTPATVCVVEVEDGKDLETIWKGEFLDA